MIKDLNLLAFCLLFFEFGFAQDFNANTNFNCRPAYVIATLEKAGDVEEDFVLGLSVCSKQSSCDFIVIGVKELYSILYNESPNNGQLISMGKVFLRDTLYTSDSIRHRLDKYLVNMDSLNYLNGLGDKEILKRYYNEDNRIKSSVSLRMVNSLIYYFDRMYYQSYETDIGWILDLNNGFRQINVVFVRRGQAMFRQVWDEYGSLVDEQEWDVSNNSPK